MSCKCRFIISSMSRYLFRYEWLHLINLCLVNSFEESGYKFEFGPQWKVIKYDDHRFYRILSGQNMSGVDFAAIYKSDTVYLIEIKNFKQYENDIIDKPITEFSEEIIEKGLDSLRLIEVIKKYLDRKFLYRAFYNLVNRFPWLNSEWYFWTELFRISIINQRANFILLINADYDLKRVTNSLECNLGEHFREVIVEPILEKEFLEGFTISKI